MLREVLDVLTAAGSTTKGLRRDLDSAEPWSVSSFQERHPGVGHRVSKDIDALAARLYIRDTDAEPAMALLEDYVRAHLEELEASWTACTSSADG